MAFMLCRSVSRLARQTAAFTAVRASSHGPSIDPSKGKIASDSISMPDTLGHSVGAERYELLQRAAGNEDPFEMNVRRRAKGTKDEPTLIPSIHDNRLVGCICEEDSVIINWMKLHQGEPMRCGCGYFFKLVPLEGADHAH